MDLSQYRHAHLFYAASIIIPLTLWSFAAYLSQIYPDQHQDLISILSLLGLIAPLIIAMVLILPNSTLLEDVSSRAFSFKKVPQKYLSLAFLLMPFSILTAQLISLFLGYSTEQFQFRNGFTFSSGVLPVWFLLVVAPIVEQLGWHSYGTDCLRNKFSLLNTSLLFAAFWGVWHLPLSFIKDYYHSNLVESGLIFSINFLVSLFPFVLIMNWLYYKSNRNILITIIFHVTAGYGNEIFATESMSKVIQTGLLSILAIYLIMNDKSFFLNTKTTSK